MNPENFLAHHWPATLDFELLARITRDLAARAHVGEVLETLTALMATYVGYLTVCNLPFSMAIT